MAVRKRQWKTSKGEAREAWTVDYVDQHGARHIKTFDRKKDADRYHAAVNVEVMEGVHAHERGSITVKAAGEAWLEAAAANGLEAATLAQYRQHLRLHIEPYLGAVLLANITPATVRKLEDDLKLGTPPPGAETGKPRSPALTRKVMVSLSSIVADAQERGKVARNVVREVRARRTRGADSRSERRQRGRLKVGTDIPAPAEIRAIVEHLEGRWRPLILAAVFTGLRASELRGLTWRDVDLDAAELHVRQRADRFNSIGKPKSDAGNRTIPLPPILVNALRQWRLICPRRDGALELVFPNGRGKVESLANIINRGLIPPQIAAGIVEKRTDTEGRPVVAARYTGMHALRHFYASWCINPRSAGGLELPPKVVQDRLGHSSIALTMNVYAHLFPRGDDAGELAAAERALLG
ncbi:tyrosine-type recombinase/integrase [Pseudoxanthobacter sp. M-2]|uniref:tyrosine-type recombinase/integrase n=1 Tax=Pseudoxanthobacter sp. M-2 TaxID=3078754 RepID=UPI0038FC455B